MGRVRVFVPPILWQTRRWIRSNPLNTPTQIVHTNKNVFFFSPCVDIHHVVPVCLQTCQSHSINTAAPRWAVPAFTPKHPNRRSLFNRFFPLSPCPRVTFFHALKGRPFDRRVAPSPSSNRAKVCRPSHRRAVCPCCTRKAEKPRRFRLHVFWRAGR